MQLRTRAKLDVRFQDSQIGIPQTVCEDGIKILRGKEVEVRQHPIL
jgi:hypothetical protein